MKVLAAQLNLTIGDLIGNTSKVLEALDRAKKSGVDIVLFSELTLTGYCPEDLLLSDSFIEATAKKLEEIQAATCGLFVVVGLPRRNPSKIEKSLYNSAAIFADGQLLGFKDKTLLPTYDVFDERRFFEPGKEEVIWEYLGHKIAITICEDLWKYSSKVEATHYSRDPLLELKDKRPDLVLNLSGSPYYFCRKEIRLPVFQSAAKALSAPLVFCNQVGANDQLVFDGHSLFVNEKGDLMQMAKGFVEDDLIVDLNTHACPCVLYRESLNDINSSNLTVRNLQESGIKDLYAALVLGVRDYFHKQGFSKAILGMSGGIDSALVGCIAKDALGEKNVLALALPSRYNSQESLFDAISLCQNINIEFRQISIDSILQNYLDLLEPLFEEGLQGLTKENLQPRIRAMILMSFSNQEGSILLNTSNKSEMAMGYSTLYGDMAGGLGVLQDVLKLQVYQLAEFVNAKQEVIPRKILTKIPSAELRVDQTDFDTLPPYEILDAVIEDYIELSCCSKEIALKRKFSLDLVESIIRKIHLAEYKRRQAPIGIRVSQKAFGKGRIIPIVQKWQSSI